MVKSPRSKPQDTTRAAAQRVKDAVAAARGRVGGEGRLVAFAGGALLLAFILLAALAPLVMRAPGFISYLVGALLFLLILVGTGAGVLALWRMIKGGALETATDSGPLSVSAVEAAFSEAEDAGLKALGERVAEDGLSGKIAGRPLVVARANGRTFGVVRLQTASEITVLFAPAGATWPFSLPADGQLTPIVPPVEASGLAWATQRDAGNALIAQLAPALFLAASAGEAPYLCLRKKALVLMWTHADVGSAALVVAQAARLLAARN